MLRRAAVLLHTLVIVTAAMIAAGGVAAFASFTYHSVAAAEDGAKARGAMEGAISEAKWDMWNLTLKPGQSSDYTLDGITVNVALTDMNGTTASAVLARATATYNGRAYFASRTIGQNRFPASESLNWIYNPTNGHYYAVVKMVRRINWTTAKSNAELLKAPDGKNAYLATITSQAEWDWVKTSLLQPTGYQEAVLGAVQPTGASEPSGGWTWANGEPWSYTCWQSGQPDNASPGQMYVRTNANADTKWVDASDWSYDVFLVEAGDWVPWITDPKTGRSYLYIAQAGLSWSAARAAAEAMTGPYNQPVTLACITSAHEFNFLVNSVMPADVGNGNWDGPWIGHYQDPAGTEPAGGWMLTSGEQVGYSIWAAGEPNESGGEDNSALMRFGAHDCTAGHSTRGYLVEAGPPLNWQYNSATQRWYAVVPLPGLTTWTEAKTWAEGLRAPDGSAGYLATITSAEESTFVTNLVTSATAPNGSSPWTATGGSYMGPYIGLTQATGSSEPSGGWSWVTGEPVSYTQWNSGEPNNLSGGTEDKAMMWLSGGTSAWNDTTDAFGLGGFVVEAGNNFPRWVQWKTADGGNGLWYMYVSKPAGITWSSAASEAAGLTSPSGLPVTLSPITSQQEADFMLASVVPSGATLGGHDGIGWVAGRQEPDSWEPKMGWEWVTGEAMSGWFKNLHWTNTASEPNETGGQPLSSGSYEDYLFAAKTSGVLLLKNWGPANTLPGYLVRSGIPSQLSTVQTQWKVTAEAAAGHPDSADGPYASGDFLADLSPREWPVLSGTGKGRMTDYDPTSSEWRIWQPGDRGSNRIIALDWGGVQDLPLDANLDDTGSPVTFGRQLWHGKGTFVLADAAAVNSVQISVPNSSDQYFVWINGKYSFQTNQSLSNRSTLVVGPNRIDVYAINRSGAGTVGLNCSVPIKPYAKPLGQVHPFQYALSVKNPIANNGAPPVFVKGNAYIGADAAGEWGAASRVDGFLYRTSASASPLTADYQIQANPLLTFPAVEPWKYAPYATATYANNASITSPDLGTGSVLYSTSAVTLSGSYSGQGTIVAGTINITASFRPKSVTDRAVLVANTINITGTAGKTSYLDAFVYTSSFNVNQAWQVRGAVCAESVNATVGSSPSLTIIHEDSLWRQPDLAWTIKVPGYWTGSGLQYQGFTYAGWPDTPGSMPDLTNGEYSGGYLRGTLGGRLTSTWRPIAGPVQRTWAPPVLKMSVVSYPGRQLNWFGSGSTITADPVSIFTDMPFEVYEIHRGGWWKGGFDMANTAAINALTMSLTGSDDMAAVFINGKLAIDQGGKHGSWYGSTSLTDKSMISIGSNRIDIFYADLCGGGMVGFDSNTSFYPATPTIGSQEPPDICYNYGLYVHNGMTMNQNITVYGDVMMGPSLRNSGTQNFKGLSWTSGSWPSGVTLGAHSVTNTALPAYPAWPLASSYQSRATESLASNTLGSRTSSISGVNLLYRNGDLNMSGTFNGQYVIFVNGNVFFTGDVLEGTNSSVTVIVAGSATINGGATTNNLYGTYAVRDTFNLNRAVTLRGNLWTQQINQNSALTIYHTGRQFYYPENWTKSCLPGYFP